MHQFKDIGASIEVGGVLVAESNDAGSDINGTAYRRSTNGRPLSAVAFAATGSATGSPSAQSHTFVVQHADDDGSGSPDTFANLTDADGNDVEIVITADDTLTEVDVDLSGAKDHVRLIYDASESSFTAGTSPENILSGGIVFGGFAELPQ